MNHPPPLLSDLLATKEIVVVGGPGGVGKTTVAASAGLLAAQYLRGRVLVLTVDPARRLATSLGLEAIGNEVVPVPAERLMVDGVEPAGELFVAQLDTKQSWDALVRRHAPDDSTRDAILGNRLYENITGTFVQSHDYIAMERLFELHTSGAFDLIVVDTPPSRNAVDFLDAPGRMTEFVGSRLLRWLTIPGRSRVLGAASRPFFTIADRVLGRQFLSEIAEFFTLLESLNQGFRARAEEVGRVLRDRRTGFVVVSTLDAASVAECEFFADALRSRGLHLDAVVLNRVLPEWLWDSMAAQTARRVEREANALATMLSQSAGGSELGSVPLVEGVLSEMARSFADYELVVGRQREVRGALAAMAPVQTTIPHLFDDVVDVAALGRIVEALRSPG